MNQIEDKTEKVFHNQDLVVWHLHTGKRALPLPGVVVRQEKSTVIIRTRVDGNVKELEVPFDELIAR